MRSLHQYRALPAPVTTAIMRFLFVCGAAYVSGLERLTLNLMSELKRQGHEVVCMVSVWNNGDFVARLRSERIDHVCARIGFVSKTLTWRAIRATLHQAAFLPAAWMTYRRLVCRVRPDAIVHTNFHHLAVLWPVLDRRRVVFHVHNTFPERKFYRGLFSILAQRIGRFVAVSHFVRSNLLRIGVPDREVGVVWNGVEDFSAPVENRLTGAPLVVGVVGQVVPWKGHEDLIDALAILREEGRRFRCLIFGAGEEKFVADLRARVDRAALSEMVEFRGFCARVDQIFAELDVCVVPSRFEEPFGLVAAEAGMAGLPVVVTRRGGLPEIVQDEETGLVVSANAPRELADALGRLIDDRRTAGRLGVAARVWVGSRFTREAMMRDFVRELAPYATANGPGIPT
jgi:glycosyltransferase involved in cell wall biosynthesis